MKKQVLLITIWLIILINLVQILATNLDVSAKPISNSYIMELDKPAVYELTIKNLGETDYFEVYSLVGININHDPLYIATGQTKKINIEVRPQTSLNKIQFPFIFEYKIKDSKEDIQKETLAINIVDLESSFLIETEPINPNSKEVILTINNNLIYDFPNIDIELSSAFFEYEDAISLGPDESKEIIISIDREKLKLLDAGSYLMNSKVTVDGKSANIESQIKFLEQEDIESINTDEGLIIKRTEIFRKNTGNVRKTIEVNLDKNMLEYLFTTVNIPATRVETSGFKRIYTWEKELIPNEEFKIVVKTNWFFPILILVIIITAIVLIRKSIYANLELIKRVSFVKTKGGQFALKITIKVKAKKNVEDVTVIDKLPRLVKLYHKFGIIEPNTIDEDNRRLVWKLKSLNKDETRILTYIIYSKIGVVGRFELPETKAIYGYDDKTKEVISNRAFYVNESRM